MTVYDADETQIGTVDEDSAFLALVRRLVELAAALLPQGYTLKDMQGTELATYKTHFNLFGHKLSVKVRDDCPLDQAVPLAVGLLLVAIEGKQR